LKYPINLKSKKKNDHTIEKHPKIHIFAGGMCKLEGLAFLIETFHEFIALVIVLTKE